MQDCRIQLSSRLFRTNTVAAEHNLKKFFPSMNRESRLARLIVVAAAFTCIALVQAAGQNTPPATQPAAPAAPLTGQSGLPPSISLSPAVIMARGTFGQGLTQTLSLTNNTSAEFAFDMEAEDVLIQNGKRVYVPAGETQNSIAATA